LSHPGLGCNRARDGFAVRSEGRDAPLRDDLGSSSRPAARGRRGGCRGPGPGGLRRGRREPAPPHRPAASLAGRSDAQPPAPQVSLGCQPPGTRAAQREDRARPLDRGDRATLRSAKGAREPRLRAARGLSDHHRPAVLPGTGARGDRGAARDRGIHGAHAPVPSTRPAARSSRRRVRRAGGLARRAGRHGTRDARCEGAARASESGSGESGGLRRRGPDPGRARRDALDERAGGDGRARGGARRSATCRGAPPDGALLEPGQPVSSGRRLIGAVAGLDAAPRPETRILRGIVLDQGGAPLASFPVAFEHETAGQRRATVSDAAGWFQMELADCEVIVTDRENWVTVGKGVAHETDTFPPRP